MQWEETFKYAGTLGDVVSKPLLLKLYDEDKGVMGGMNDALGELSLPIDGLLTKGKRFASPVHYVWPCMCRTQSLFRR